jgi:alkanesulfonate monooxygenase SsuD/methylene tetrahydromethanopterin reductase-like flavin-dependent oxidoreductase (luciferase family)
MPPIRFGAFLMPHLPEEQFAIARRVDALGFDSIWTGDHVSFHHPLYDSLTLLASYIGITSRVKLGVGVYLLALRHPTVAAKITSTLDALSGGRLIFGVGVGGENPKEFEARGIPHRSGRASRGHRRRARALARLTRLFKGPCVRGREHRPQACPEARAAHLIGGRPTLRLPARAAGRRLDSRRPGSAKQSLAKIEAAASAAGRSLEGFAKGHLTFITLGKDYESAERVWVDRLSKRYAQDFGPLAKKYGIIGTPDQCAEQLQRFIEAGCSYFVLDAICDAIDEAPQIETFAAEILPKFRGVSGAEPRECRGEVAHPLAAPRGHRSGSPHGRAGRADFDAGSGSLCPSAPKERPRGHPASPAEADDHAGRGRIPGGWPAGRARPGTRRVWGRRVVSTFNWPIHAAPCSSPRRSASSRAVDPATSTRRGTAAAPS